MSFARACALSELDAGRPVATRVGGTAVVVVRQRCDDAEEIFALLDECSHGAVRLSEGELDGCALECWLHGARFDLRFGDPLCPPATEPVPTYPTKVEGDEVLVDVDNPITPEEN